MIKAMTCLTTVLLALMVGLPTLGCRPKDEKDEKVLDIQVDTGTTKVKVEGNKTPDADGKHLDVDVDVDHAGHDHEQE